MIRGLLIGALLASTGCSFLMVPRVRDADLEAPGIPVCNDRYLAPLGDHALAGLGWPAVGVTGLVLSIRARCETDGCHDRKTAGLVLFPVSLVAGALVHYLSGRYGLRNVARCRALKTAEAKRPSPGPPLEATPAPPPASAPEALPPPPIEAPAAPEPSEEVTPSRGEAAGSETPGPARSSSSTG